MVASLIYIQIVGVQIPHALPNREISLIVEQECNILKTGEHYLYFLPNIARIV